MFFFHGLVVGLALGVILTLWARRWWRKRFLRPGKGPLSVVKDVGVNGVAKSAKDVLTSLWASLTGGSDTKDRKKGGRS